MELPSPFLIATHLLAFGGGGATFWLFIRWEARKVSGPAVHNPPNRARRVPVLAVIFIGVATLMTGFGIQQSLYQKDATERDECHQAWGVEVIDTLESRVASTTELEQAQKELDLRRDKRSNAFADLVNTVVLLRTVPPKANDQDLDAALRKVARTDARVDEQAALVTLIENERDVTRAQNPYPDLDC